MSAMLIVMILTGTGLFFGVLLAVANSAFGIESEPLVDAVEDILPKGQCGACGFAGCRAYAEAVVKNPATAVNLCAPGKENVATKIAQLTGKHAAPAGNMIAHVRCAGVIKHAKRIFEYGNVRKCVSAQLLQGGNKACIYGCIGLGSCISECAFGALSLTPGGVPVVDPQKCCGCGKCSIVCPKHVIEMLPIDAVIRIACHSQDKGVSAKKNCRVACIGCGKCEKACLHGGIIVKNNLPVIDHSICSAHCIEPLCMAVCPVCALQHAFRSMPAAAYATALPG